MPATDSSGPPHDLRRLVAALDCHGVDYLLVGAAAARAYGATRLTEDADCVVRRERSNLDRLAAAMRELNARLRVQGMSDEEARQLPVQLDGKMLASAELSTWMTDAGALDVLPGLQDADGAIVPYDDLAQRQTIIRGEGFAIRAAALQDIIAAKERATGPRTMRPCPSCVPSATPVRATPRAPAEPHPLRDTSRRRTSLHQAVASPPVVVPP